MSLYKGVSWNEPVAIVGTAVPKLQAEVITSEPPVNTPGLLVYTALGFADNPLRIDPTGTTTQPVTIVGGGGGTSQFAMGSVQVATSVGTIALGYDGTNVRGIQVTGAGAIIISDPAEGIVGNAAPSTAILTAGEDYSGTLRAVLTDPMGQIISPAGERIPVIVQKKNTSGTANTTLALAFNSNVKQGNTIVVTFVLDTASNIAATISDSLGNVYQTCTGNSGNAMQGMVVFAPIMIGGACTITLTVNTSVIAAMEIYEVSGLGEVEQSGNLTGTSAGAVSLSLAFQVTQPNEMLFAFVGAGAGSITSTAPVGLTADAAITGLGGVTLKNFSSFSGILGSPLESTFGNSGNIANSFKATIGASVALFYGVAVFRPKQYKVLVVDVINSIALADGINNALPTRATSGNSGLGNSAMPAFVPSVPFLFNGSTWDRQRNNFDTTTGDTGVKNASGNGATQTNFNARVAFITVLAGAVVGAGILSFQFQWSIDGGTTWLSAGTASGNITASGQTACFVVGAGIAAAPTTGATQTVAVQMPLPRTWRMTWTLVSGTSVVITAVYVNYQN